MGNYKFRLSDMIPNAWFYKLKNNSKQHPTKNKNNKNHHPHHHQYLTSTTTTTSSSAPTNHHHTTTATTTTTQEPISHSRHSYYFTRELLIKPHNHHPIQQLLPNSPTNPKTTDIHFPPDPPRKSSSKKRRPNKKKNNRTTIKPSSFTSSVSSGCSCRATLESVWINNKSDSTPDYSVVSVSPDEIDFQDLPPDQFDSIGAGGAHSWSSTSCSSSTCRVSSSSPTEKCEKIDGFFDAVSMLDLPPIVTKPVKFSTKKATNLSSKIRKSCSAKIVKQESSMKTLKDHQKVIIRRPSPISPGLKIRLNSPRIISRKTTTHSKDMTSRIAQSLLGPKAKQRTPPTTSTAFRSNAVQPRSSRKPTSSISSRNKNVSDTFAIIKSSFDPQRDFRESMVEMIVENNIRTSRDLEELLACYLSLNSDEYHDLIVKVFEQIWFDLTETRL